MIKVPLSINDIILTGKFRNRPVEIKTIGIDKNNQPTINGKPMLAFRIKKLMPKKEQVENPSSLSDILEKEIVQEKVVKRNGMWFVVSHSDPNKVFGKHNTKQEALVQLRAIQINKGS